VEEVPTRVREKRKIRDLGKVWRDLGKRLGARIQNRIFKA